MWGKADDERIEVESLISGTPSSPHYLRGLVLIKWGDKSAQMSIKDARHHAISILEAAGSAEQDELVMRWLMTTMKMPLEAAGAAMLDVRKHRKDWFR